MTDLQKMRIADMRGGGASYGEIAKAVGISLNTVKAYGRRVGLVAPMNPPDEGLRSCKQCGMTYPQPEKRKLKLFCSDSCRLAWWHENRALLNSAVSLVCRGCGSGFMGNPRRKYCSHECSVRARFGGERHAAM